MSSSRRWLLCLLIASIGNVAENSDTPTTAPPSQDNSWETVLTHTSCPLTVPPKIWPGAAAYWATTSGVPRVGVLNVSRCEHDALDLENFCADDKFASSSFVFDGDGPEWSASAKFFLGARLTYRGTACELTGIVIWSDGPGGLRIRFQFERCTGSPNRVAAVVLGLTPDSTADSNLVPWMCRISGKACATALPPDATTSTTTITQAAPPSTTTQGLPATTLVAQTIVAPTAAPVGTQPPPAGPTVQGFRLIGMAGCNGGPNLQQNDKPLLTSIEACRNTCLASPSNCTGFAFNAEAAVDKCYQFSGASISGGQQALPATGLPPGQYGCWAPGNTSTARMLSANDAPQMLRISKVFGHRANIQLPATALLRRITPPALKPDCYKSVDWYVLEDIAGNLATLPFHPEHWDDLKSMLPLASVAPSAGAVPGNVAIGRVHLTVCKEAAVPPTCVTPPEAQAILGSSHIIAEECKRRALRRSALVGVFASIGAGFFLFFLCHRDRKRREQHRPSNPFSTQIGNGAGSSQYSPINNTQSNMQTFPTQNGFEATYGSSLPRRRWQMSALGACVAAVVTGIALDFIFGVVWPVNVICGLDMQSHFGVWLWRRLAGICPPVVATLLAVYFASQWLHPDDAGGTHHKILIAHVEEDEQGQPIGQNSVGPFVIH